jgi:hypothetical protein
LGTFFIEQSEQKLGSKEKMNNLFILAKIDPDIQHSKRPSISIKRPLNMILQGLLYLTTITGHFHQYSTALNGGRLGGLSKFSQQMQDVATESCQIK